MYYRVLSSAVKGIEGYIVSVEVDIAGGFPRFDIIGLPDSSVKESTDRVRTALRNSGFQLPVERITVNLAPAHMRKVGAGFDLAVAMGIMACRGQVPRKECEGVLFLGELSLSGEVKPVKGILPMIHSAAIEGIKRCLVPSGNVWEASVVPGIEVIGVEDLVQTVGYLKGAIDISETRTDVEKLFQETEQKNSVDFSDVKGQQHVRRAVEVAVAGMHNLAMIGPPGSGKTMIAKRIPTIMPKISFEESVEVTKVRSVSGLIVDGQSLVTSRPFRSPHHTISDVSLIGGGAVPKPGEISLAHNGVLFLDELTEFRKHVIDVLRQPLEAGEVTISRVNSSVRYPAKFMLVTSMNPCPCGYHPDTSRCNCDDGKIQRYISRISGPILDRIDIHVEAGGIDFAAISSEEEVESSSEIAGRVSRAIELQKERHRNILADFNAHLTSGEVERFCRLDEGASKMLTNAFAKLGLSARAYHRILKVGRTIADLDGADIIGEKHIAEAIQYRMLDRKYWHNHC